jgi:hypothetical protein
MIRIIGRRRVSPRLGDDLQPRLGFVKQCALVGISRSYTALIGGGYYFSMGRSWTMVPVASLEHVF